MCARAAKNVILAGVKSVTVHDTAEAQLRDLAAQFYLSKADVGRNRAEACRERLQELNTAVNVTASAAELTQDFLSQFQVRARAAPSASNPVPCGSRRSTSHCSCMHASPCAAHMGPALKGRRAATPCAEGPSWRLIRQGGTAC